MNSGWTALGAKDYRADVRDLRKSWLRPASTKQHRSSPTNVTDRLQHVLLLALIVPQLLLLGMGRSLVVCVSSAGHMQVEPADSSCCDPLPQTVLGEATDGQDSETNGSEDCGSCSDLAIIVDLNVSKRLGNFQVGSGPILPLDSWQAAFLFEPRPEFGKPFRAFDRASTHLTRLRCVVLRC